MLASCKQLAPRVQSFLEINVDFYFYSDNVFTFKETNILPMFSMMARDEENGIESVESNPTIKFMVANAAKRLFTVCSIFTEFPYI